MTVAEYIVGYIASQKVTHIFELSGGMITPLLDAAARIGSPRLVSMHHEQAAGFAAEGFARITGIPGVAFATSGPGVTNLLTPIASCFYDSIPAVFISGQVNRDEIRRGNASRQLGFQEMDACGVTYAITKAAWQIHDPNAVPRWIEEAFTLASYGRPGPVLIDIPFDVQRSEIHLAEIPTSKILPQARATADDVTAAIEMLRSGKRPLILVGGGCEDTSVDVRRMIDHIRIPTVHSLMAKDLLPDGHPMLVGMIGSYGNRWANWALAKCDALLVLGSRLDIRQTGANVQAFTAGKRIMQVDIDPSEFNSRVAVEREIKSDVGIFCGAMINALTTPPLRSNGFSVEAWCAEIAHHQAIWPDLEENTIPDGAINPNAFMRTLGYIATESDAMTYVVDVGQHQMWAAQSLPINRYGQRFLTSGGHGAMGFAIPAAIGAALATGKKTVVIVGDGGFQINAGALHTIMRLGLPIKIVVMDNDGHGMVRQFQREVFGREVSTSVVPPLASAVAAGYGIRAGFCGGSDMIDHWLRWLFKDEAPALLEVPILSSIGAFPKLTHGKTLDMMDPPKGE